VLLVAVVVAASVTDIRRGIVPNGLTFPAMGLGLLLWTAAGAWGDAGAVGLERGWTDALLGLIAGLLPMAMLVLATNALGMGDAKLLGAVGALLASPPAVLETVVYAFAVGFVGCVGYIVATGRVRETGRRVFWLLVSGSGSRQRSVAGRDEPPGSAESAEAEQGSEPQAADRSAVPFRVVRTENVGPGLARNAGVATAMGEYILFLDDDATSPPHWIGSMVARCEAHGCDVLCGGIDAYSVEEPVAEYLHLRMQRSLGANAKSLKAAPTGNLLIKRAAFEQVGGFAEERLPAAEDWELSHRLRAAGFRIMYDPAVSVVHRYQSDLDAALRRMRALRHLTRLPAAVAAKLLGRAQVFVGLLEDLGYPENRVTWGAGAPEAIDIAYTLHPELLARRRAFRRAIKAGLRGHRHLFLSRAPELNFGHPCGTLRFGDDPKTSVLDAGCRAHGIDNLYVADASFMPSSMGVNPGLTIAANALRVADAIARRREADG